MNITATAADGKSIVSIHGDLRITSVADARTELAAVLATAAEIRLDLSDLGECDTAGVQLLLMAVASARANGRNFATTGHTASFRAALDRAGIGAECLECQAAAPAGGQGGG